MGREGQRLMLSALPVTISIWMFIKLFFLVLLFFYFILSLVIVRQVDLMGQVVSTEVTPTLKMATMLHSLIAGALFFLAVVIL